MEGTFLTLNWHFKWKKLYWWGGGGLLDLVLRTWTWAWQLSRYWLSIFKIGEGKDIVESSLCVLNPILALGRYVWAVRVAGHQASVCRVNPSVNISRSLHLQMSARDLKILSEQTRLIYTDNHVTIARELLSYLWFHKFFLEYFTISNNLRHKNRF